MVIVLQQLKKQRLFSHASPGMPELRRIDAPVWADDIDVTEWAVYYTGKDVAKARKEVNMRSIETAYAQNAVTLRTVWGLSCFE